MVSATIFVPMMRFRAEAQARLDLASIVYNLATGETEAALSARLTTVESTVADLSLNKAAASDLAVLNAQINTPTTGIAAQVADLNSAVAVLDPDSAVATIQQTAAAARSHGLQLEMMGETLLSILTALQSNAKRIAATLAFVSTTITAQVTDGQSALARSIADTTAMLQTADLSLSANITTVNEASVTRDNALTLRADTLQSWFGAGIDATNTVASKISTEATTRASADTALSSRTTTLESALTGLTGGGAVQAAITAEASTRATADTALSSRATTLEAALTGLTGSGAVSAAISSEASARASADTALSSRTSTLEAALTGLTGKPAPTRRFPLSPWAAAAGPSTPAASTSVSPMALPRMQPASSPRPVRAS
jgi:hypothetical protein